LLRGGHQLLVVAGYSQVAEDVVVSLVVGVEDAAGQGNGLDLRGLVVRHAPEQIAHHVQPRSPFVIALDDAPGRDLRVRAQQGLFLRHGVVLPALCVRAAGPPPT
jgi:hypothetical protein